MALPRALEGFVWMLVLAVSACSGKAMFVAKDGAVDGPRPSLDGTDQGSLGGTPGTGGMRGTGGIAATGGASSATSMPGGFGGMPGGGTGGSSRRDGGPRDDADRSETRWDGPAAIDTDGSADRSTDGRDLPASPDANPACGVAGTVVKPADVSEFVSYLLGQWLYCDGSYLLGKQHDGLEFTADGRWYLLFADGKGGYARGKGFDGGGTWQVVTGSHFQVDMELAGGGGDALSMAFQIAPTAMRTSSMGGTANYVKATVLPPIDGGVDGIDGGGSTELPSPAEAKLLCGKSGNPVEPTDKTSFLAYFLGRWTYCGPSSLFGIAHDGIELVADGTWYFLHADGNGGLVRGAGFDGGGDWEVLADNNYQVNLSTSGGMNYLFAAFQTDPLAMRVKWMGGTADYVRTGPNPSPTADGGGSTSDTPL